MLQSRVKYIITVRISQYEVPACKVPMVRIIQDLLFTVTLTQLKLRVEQGLEKLTHAGP